MVSDKEGLVNRQSLKIWPRVFYLKYLGVFFLIEVFEVLIYLKLSKTKKDLFLQLLNMVLKYH